MRDVIAIAIVVGFFVLCAAYIAWCDRIVGDDQPLVHATAPGEGSAADNPAAGGGQTTRARS